MCLSASNAGGGTSSAGKRQRHAIMLRSLASRGPTRSHAHRFAHCHGYRAINHFQRYPSVSQFKSYSTDTGGNVGNDQPSAEPTVIPAVEEPKRKTASFFISNVLPIQVGKFE